MHDASIYNAYTAIAILLLLLCQVLGRTCPSPAKPSAHLNDRWQTDFESLRWRYLLGFIPAMLADWMMGAHLYALYRSFGHSVTDVATLFMIGFASSAIFGTCIASVTDQCGRRRGCLLYAATYAASALCNNTATWCLHVCRNVHTHLNRHA